MMNRSKLVGFMALAAMMEATKQRPDYPEKREVTEQDLNNINRLNGLTEFTYSNQGTIWALNQKNADKKARKKGWL